MRPQQQNRRMRGRGNNPNSGNNNRRGPNPLTRNYESNGPDVKIRGSAQQIAEKYGNLARDAQSAGDRVMAENYLQHAEHYNRIIAAAQAQMPVQQMRDQRDSDDEDEDRDERDGANMPPSSDTQGRSADDGSGPQPVIEGMPVEVEQEVLNRGDDQEARMNGAHGGEAEDNTSRRPRRQRRGRGRPEDAAVESEAGSAEGPDPESGARKVIVPAAE